MEERIEAPKPRSLGGEWFFIDLLYLIHQSSVFHQSIIIYFFVPQVWI